MNLPAVSKVPSPAPLANAEILFRRLVLVLATVLFFAALASTRAQNLYAANDARGTVSVTVPGSANPWLALSGATDDSGDSVPAETPVRVDGLTLSPGATLTFSATGLVNNSGGDPVDPPDGSAQLFPHPAENGLSGVLTAVDSLLGVFVDDSPADPTNANAPATLDYSDPASVPGGFNFTTLQPKLGQVFFIGDGKNTAGATEQVTVPAGATHLVLGTMDGSGWYNNTGAFQVTITTGVNSVPLTATTLTVIGANLGAAVAKGTPLTFTATQGAVGAGVYVRVQASLTPSIESSWTDLPDTTNGGAGFLKGDGKGNYSLTTTQYPSGNVSFRAITAEQGQTDSISNVLQSFAVDIALLTVNPDDLSYTVAGQGTTNQVVPGDKINYSLTVRNTGFEPATGLVVQATFDPANTKLKKVSDGGTASGSVLTWTLPTLANGDHHTFTFSVKVNAGVDTKNNIGTGAGVHSAGSNNGQVYINPETVPEIVLHIVPAFNISVSNNGAQTAAGSPLTFTFTVSNRGSGPVSNISVYVPLPSGYVPANFKSAQLIDANGNPVGSPFKLGAAINGGIDQNAVLVTISSIAAGQLQQFLFTVNVPYSAPPGSDVTLPVVTLTGYQSDGSQVTFGQNDYVAQISNQPPAALPNLALLKVVPTAGNIQTLQGLANAGGSATANPLVKAAKQLFAALATATGTSTSVLLATPADQLAQLINPYVSRDTDPTSGDSLFDVPSPNAKQPAPYITYLLVFFNAGNGTAAGITISDAVANGLQLDPTSISVKGATLAAGNVLGSDGRSLTFALGQVKPGVGGAILYRALVPAPGAGGPNLGDTIQPITASLTTASLSNQVFDTPLESLLITGKANAMVDASESDPGDGTAVYNIFYRNTGGLKSNDFVIVSEVPQGGAFVSADFLDFNQNVIAGSLYPDGTKHVSAAQYIEPIASGATNGQTVFHLGKVTPHGQGFVQVKYQLTAAGLTHSTAGLTHHYYVDGSSFPGAPAVASASVGQPIPRVVGRGPQTRGFDLLGAFKAGLDNIGHALLNFIRPGSFPTVAPTIWVSRVAPLAVQEDTDFSYFITVGNCGKTTAFDVFGGFDAPSGATFKSGTGGTFTTFRGLSSFNLHLDSLAAGQSQTVTVTFHATAAAGSNIVSDSTGFSAFGTGANDFPTGYVTTGKTSSFVYSAAQAATFDDLKTSIVSSAARAGGVDPTALTGGVLFPTHLAALTPQSTQTTIAHADYLTTTTGATIVAQGGGNIVAQGGGNIVAQGGGNIVAQGGGNIVAQGGGNIILNNVTGFSGAVSVADLFSAKGLATIVAQGGGNIVAQGGGNIVAQGGGNILNFQTGDNLISTSALQFATVAAAGFGNALSENLIGQDGNGVISNDGGSIISQDGNGLVSQTGGGLYADGGAALQGTGGGGTAQRLGGRPVRRTSGIPAGTTLGSPTNSVHLDFNNAGSLVFGVGGSQFFTQDGGN